MTSASATIDIASSAIEKRPSTDEGASMRKHNMKAGPEHPADVLGSATRAPIEKGKGSVEVEEAPERGYTI
ncbi:hypothetical protein BHM03_00032547 [Ensete ventricosum]|nr:hypothetical protein BHM03_00032547 [Ensete ventricosum]